MGFVNKLLKAKTWMWVVLPSLLVVPSTGFSVMYSAPMDQSEWRLEPSLLECRLTHPIPYYGEATFSRKAGEDLEFHLSAQYNPMKAGKASLVIEPPVWKHSVKAIDLGHFPVKQQNQPVTVAKVTASRMLNELFKGMKPVFTRKTWYGDTESTKVSLSSVNFRGSYQDYLGCVQALLPVGFRQVARSRIEFDTDEWKVTEKIATQLDLIARYVAADPTITSLYVDGHTDSIGRRVYNRDLSRRRSDSITEYLLKKGVKEDMLSTRYHGERFPTVKNNSKGNRAKNRRVTVRLERS